MSSLVNITGKRYGRLTVLTQGRKRLYGGSVAWRCRCDCGNTVLVVGISLRRGLTRSCGCLQRDAASVQAKAQAGIQSTKHGLYKSREYLCWVNAKQRCYNPHRPEYKNYGGRGIGMCKRWRNSFEAFYADMGPCPPGLTLERKNNHKGYTPSNCKWATWAEQARNKRYKRLDLMGEK